MAVPYTVSVSDFRWQVTLGVRTGTANAQGGETDTIVNQQTLWANVEPVGTAAYLAGQQTDEDQITHRITTYWRPAMEVFTEITRTRRNLIDGSTITETFQVRRWREVGGHNMFSQAEATLMGMSITPAGGA